MNKFTPVFAALLLTSSVGYMSEAYASSSQTTKTKHTTKNKSQKHAAKQNINNVQSKPKVDTQVSSNPQATPTTQTDAQTKESTIAETTAPMAASSHSEVSVKAIDCLYQLSTTTPISDAELTQWAQQAVVKSFDYSFDKLDSQLQNLKSCFTDQGWLGFNDALKQSGNLTVIKTQQLTVSSEIEGQLQIDPFKNNQWKITVPLKVVYQNTQEKFIQSLNVELIVAKKSATQLGIVQLIAAPKSKDGQLVSKAS